MTAASTPPPDPGMCPSGDPACPCPDGLLCHYQDAGGTPAWPVPPLWSIMIATLASRRELLGELLGVLLPQCEADGRVEVLACYDNGEHLLPAKRQALLGAAAGRWVSCIDDDDMVAAGFVSAVTRAMTAGCYLRRAGVPPTYYGPVTVPDFIAFEQNYYVDGALCGHVVTGLHHREPCDRDGILVRPVTHINPVRRALTEGLSFGTAAPGEDREYVLHVWPQLRTQAVIGEVLYHYRHRTHDSVQRALAPHTGLPRLEVESPCFRWIEVP